MLLVAAVKIKMARWDFPCLRWAPTWVTFHVDVPIWWYWLWRLLRAWLFPSNQDIGHHDPWWSKVLIGVDGSSSVLSGFIMQESSMKIRCIRQCQHLTNVCHHEHQSDRAVVTLQTKSEDLPYFAIYFAMSTDCASSFVWNYIHNLYQSCSWKSFLFGVLRRNCQTQTAQLAQSWSYQMWCHFCLRRCSHVQADACRQF